MRLRVASKCASLLASCPLTGVFLLSASSSSRPGKEFDSSYSRGQPATFGVTQVIAGWTQILQIMSVGDIYEVTIPSELAYGARGAGGLIGPNAVLQFKIELLGIEGKDL